MFRHKGTAVITGVASGTSLIYARRMAALGYDLILVGCDRERLHTTARRITDVCGRCVEVLAGDLAVSEDLQRIEQMLRDDRLPGDRDETTANDQQAIIDICAGLYGPDRPCERCPPFPRPEDDHKESEE